VKVVAREEVRRGRRGDDDGLWRLGGGSGGEGEQERRGED
jgi:hypothetical protein